jgi:hypothetical protein
MNYTPFTRPRRHAVNQSAEEGDPVGSPTYDELHRDVERLKVVVQVFADALQALTAANHRTAIPISRSLAR